MSFAPPSTATLKRADDDGVAQRHAKRGLVVALFFAALQIAVHARVVVAVRLQRDADLLFRLREQAIDLTRRHAAVGVLLQLDVVARGGFELVLDAFEFDLDGGGRNFSTEQQQVRTRSGQD